MEKSLKLRLGAVFPDVWSRVDGIEVTQKNAELFIQLNLILNKEFVSSEWGIDTRVTGEGDDRYQCVCSKLELTVPFVVIHNPTGEKFLIGSSCIHKFGNEELDKEVRAHKRANKCIGGNIIMDARTRDGRAGLCGVPGCLCRPCPACEHPGASCRCETCDFCEKHPSDCKCKTCEFCKKKTQICKCKKCRDCRTPVPEQWMTRCKPCWIDMQQPLSCASCGGSGYFQGMRCYSCNDN